MYYRFCMYFNWTDKCFFSIYDNIKEDDITNNPSCPDGPNVQQKKFAMGFSFQILTRKYYNMYI